MKHFFSISLVALLCFTLFPLTSEGLMAQQVYKNVKGSIFTLYSLDFQTKRVKARGSAVAIRKNILATNCHIALSGNYLIVKLHDQKKFRVARLFYKNEKQDLCLLEMPGSNFTSVKIRPSADVKIGEEVYAIGNPKGTEKSLSKGIISNKHTVKGGVWLQTDAAVHFGSSGGGLFDSDGRLIGIMTKMGGNFGFAIPTEWILQVVSPQQNQAKLSLRKHPKMYPQAVKALSYLGTYGQDKIQLYRYNRECFLFIPGTDTNGRKVSLILWNPKFATTLVIFPSSRLAQEAVSVLYKSILEKKTQKQNNYESKSKIIIAGQAYPLFGARTSDKKYPFLITRFSQDPRAVFLNSNSFKIVFEDDDPSIGNETILYHLKGIAQGLSAYNAKCAR